MTRRSLRFAAAGAAVGLVLVSALASANSIPGSNAGTSATAIGADALKPAACGGITLTTVSLGSGGNAAELVLGTAAANNPLRGFNGNDCILGGGGNDNLRGDGGTDVCIGGPGTDTFHATCETQIQ